MTTFLPGMPHPKNPSPAFIEGVLWASKYAHRMSCKCPNTAVGDIRASALKTLAESLEADIADLRVRGEERDAQTTHTDEGS